MRGLSNFEKVLEFHDTFGLDVGSKPTNVSNELNVLRLNLIREESIELEVAAREGNLQEMVDALIDLLYVTYGYLVALGVDADAAFEEVHSSNMSKLDENGNPIYREDGKVMKGPNFMRPRKEKLLVPIGA